MTLRRERCQSVSVVNQTCGFPASGFPTGFIVRPTAVSQRQDAEFPKDHVAGESSRSAVGDLVSPREEVSYASADVMIDGLVGLAAGDRLLNPFLDRARRAEPSQ